MHELMPAARASLIPLLWLAWVLYWWLGAGPLKAVQKRESPAQRASHGLPLLAAALLFLLPRRALGPLAAPFMPYTWGDYGNAVLLVALGLGFAVWARRHLGANWSAAVTLKQEHTLVQSGPYRRLRHPIYTGLLLAIAGSALALAQWRGLLALLLVTGSLLFKLRREERWMLERFGDAYRAYRARSWALLPGIY